MADLVELLRTYLSGGTAPRTFDDALSATTSALKTLVEDGTIVLGDDCNLGGEALEARVRLLFVQAGLGITSGRPSLEDFVVQPPAGAATLSPWVVEVKSSSKVQLRRDDLRQLDDWVFDLSQEEQARKQGLGGGIDPLAIVTNGYATRRHHHPSPHKGVLVVNAPVGTRFDSRTQPVVSPNDSEFVNKRNFCVIPLPVLVSYANAITDGKRTTRDLWDAVHTTCGILE